MLEYIMKCGQKSTLHFRIDVAPVGDTSIKNYTNKRYAGIAQSYIFEKILSACFSNVNKRIIPNIPQEMISPIPTVIA